MSKRASQSSAVRTRRPVLSEPDVLRTLAHPVRLDVLTFLMASGPATASVCARAVGDTPSNCSYHLRALARHGLVEPAESLDGRKRPWQATITGFDLDREGGPEAGAVRAASLSLEQRRQREYLAQRDRIDPAWRAADAYSTYVLRLTPAEMSELTAQLDTLIRPLLSVSREDPPAEAELVHVGLYAFPAGRS
jgi:DNA-binding transcriptional ArsR family regulator